MRRFNNDYDRPYITFNSKNQMAKIEIEALRKRGIILKPVIIKDNTIAHSWWALAWNKNLESYADYKSRIARGRMYLKNDAVLDLNIKIGVVDALVQGSHPKPYKIKVHIEPISEIKWKHLLEKSEQQIENLKDLVDGRFPKSLSNLFTIKGEGLFPTNQEIKFECTCADTALMCKHVAAVLYGIGARFDEDPLLFFTLRNIDFEVFLSKSIQKKMQNMLKNADKKSDRVIEDDSIYKLFDI